MPNKLSTFWQELKRRKVVRVITVYAAASFVILELLSIIIEPLRLPEWTLQFAIVFLCIGFIVTIIIAWIYDITPEGGIIKTEPVYNVKKEDKPVSSKGWKIASYSSFVVIAALIIFHLLSRNNRLEESVILDKSIAVLPFTSLSDDPEKQYLADGVMEDILLQLAKIEELRVMSSTSVQQYRNSDKTATEICQELDVSYLLEGRFQKIGDQAKLIVQLIQPGIEGHAWAKDYNREWKDVFAVQSEVAQSVAKELQAVITPEEKQLIEKIPTTDFNAYDYYLRGKEVLSKSFRGDYDDSLPLERAKYFFHKALEFDTTYARAYSGLALANAVQWYNDSVLFYANKALSFDDQLAEAYVAKGIYYTRSGEAEIAIRALDRATELNPNDWLAYYVKMTIYWITDELVNSYENAYKAAALNRGSELPELFRMMSRLNRRFGFPEKAKYYLQKAFELDGDSSRYYGRLGDIEGFVSGNFETALELFKKAYSLDTANALAQRHLGTCNMFLDQYQEALYYLEKYHNLSGTTGILHQKIYRLGYVYWKLGYKEKAEEIFTSIINDYKRRKELGQPVLDQTYLAVASVYAFRGEKNKAYEYLRLYNQSMRYVYSYNIHIIKINPLLNNIRDEPEFKQIVTDLEARYNSYHEEVRQWLEENDML